MHSVTNGTAKMRDASEQSDTSTRFWRLDTSLQSDKISKDMIVYFNGKYMRKEEVAISPDDRGFLLADGIYEVIRAYEGRLFKCAEHLERLDHGLRDLQIKGIEAKSLGEVLKRLLADNALEGDEALVYMQVTRGAAPRGHEFPIGTTPTVYVEAKPYTPQRQLQEDGVTAILAPDQRWSRCDIKTILLLPNTLARQRAKEAGAFEAIFCCDGLLHEGSRSSILFVKKDRLVCPPLTNRVLPSVTRSVVIGLAMAESIEVETRPCRESELLEFDEVMMLGTGVEIVPITAINGRKIRQGQVGPITKCLQKAFRAAVNASRTPTLPP